MAIHKKCGVGTKILTHKNKLKFRKSLYCSNCKKYQSIEQFEIKEVNIK